LITIWNQYSIIDIKNLSDQEIEKFNFKH